MLTSQEIIKELIKDSNVRGGKEKARNMRVWDQRLDSLKQDGSTHLHQGKELFAFQRSW